LQDGESARRDGRFGLRAAAVNVSQLPTRFARIDVRLPEDFPGDWRTAGLCAKIANTDGTRLSRMAFA
jgi:hypothetical protein